MTPLITLLSLNTDQVLSEAERIIRNTRVSERDPRFDLIVEGEGQCKLYRDPFMIVLFVSVDAPWIRTFQASERVFRSPELQQRFLVFSQEVTKLQRSIERRFNRPTDSMWRR